MTEVQHIDGGMKFDLEKGVIGGIIWKRHHIVTVIKYDDNALIQTIALDFQANTKYAQPIINNKMREVKQQRQEQKVESLLNSHNGTIVSIADELRKLAELRSEEILTEQEFQQINQDLIRK